MLILGLNAYHGDSSACLLKDGRLVAAVEEERFRRVKHWAGLPTQAIEYCLREAGAALADVEHIAVNRQPGVNNWRRLQFILTHRPDPRLVFSKLRNIRKAATIEDALHAAFPAARLRARIHHVEHHLAHLASAFLASEFSDAVCLSVDGFGDFASAAWGMGRGPQIDIDDRVYFPHSLGIFYSAITQFIGFPWFGDEYKVMGLAPYGEPKFLPQMREIVRVQADGAFKLNLRCFRHHNENVSYTWNDCCPEVGTLYRKDSLEAILGPERKKGEPLDQRHKDIARSAQAMYEESFFALLNALHRKYQCPNLALSGGCAMNSVANGKVYLRSPFKRMYLPAAAGDAGGAIGSALVVWTQLSTGEGSGVQGSRFKAHSSTLPPYDSQLPSRLTAPLLHAYTGPQFPDAEIEALLRTRGLLGAPASGPATPADASFFIRHFPDESALCAATAQAVSEGKVIGWFQGRMEWGPRALGNRSILGDPRRADMKDILNLKIKRRESFRPFAPSILRERVADWFEQDDDVPFMMEVFQIRPEQRARIPAVCHVDGSGRLQTVHRDTNPRYHALISAFEKLTGVPIVLNTSFNENEPVVCRPEEALDCFLRTQMDVLVMEGWMINRTGQAAIG
jgi:carbamoyltransferase